VEPNPNIPAIASIEAACSREVERVATPLTDEQRRAIRVALRSALSPQAAAPQAGAGYGDTSPGDVIAAYADGQIVLDDGIETTSYPRACAFLHAALSSAQARVAELERQRDEDTDQINALSTERDQAREELEEARQHGNENIAALHVAEQERDRERAARELAEARVTELESRWIKWDTLRKELTGEAREAAEKMLAAPPRPATAGQDDKE
jgi:hypothetical protein